MNQTMHWTVGRMSFCLSTDLRCGLNFVAPPQKKSLDLVLNGTFWSIRPLLGRTGGRPIYIADMLRILSAPDTEEPNPTIRDEGSESEDSAQSDEIFTSTQYRLFAMFEDLLVEHAQHSCTRFERSLRATQVWQAIGSRGGGANHTGRSTAG